MSISINLIFCDPESKPSSNNVTLDISSFFTKHSQFLVTEDYVEHGKTLVDFTYNIQEKTISFLRTEIEILKLQELMSHKSLCYKFRLDIPTENERLQQDVFLDQFFRRKNDSVLRCHIAFNETAPENVCDRFIKAYAPTLNLSFIKPGKRYMINKLGTKFILPNDSLKPCAALTEVAQVANNYRNFFRMIYDQFWNILEAFNHKSQILGDLYGDQMEPIKVMNICQILDGRTTSKKFPDFQILQLPQMAILDYIRQVKTLNGIFFNDNNKLDAQYSLCPSQDGFELMKNELFNDKTHLLVNGDKVYFKILDRLKERLIQVQDQGKRKKRSWQSFWGNFYGLGTKNRVDQISNDQSVIQANERIIQNEFRNFKDNQRNITLIFQNLEGNMKLLARNEKLLKRNNNTKSLVYLITLHKKGLELLTLINTLRDYLVEIKEISDLIFTDQSISLFPSHLLKGVTQNIIKHKIIKVDVSVENVILTFTIPKRINIKKLTFKMLPMIANNMIDIYECTFPEIHFWTNLYLPRFSKKALNNFIPLSQNPNECVPQLFFSYLHPTHAKITQCPCHTSKKIQDLMVIDDHVIIFSSIRDELKINCKDNNTRHIIEVGYTKLKIGPYCNISTRNRDFILTQTEKFHINSSHIYKSVIFNNIDLPFDSNQELAQLNLSALNLKPIHISTLHKFNNNVKQHGHVIDYMIFVIIFFAVSGVTIFCCIKRKSRKSTVNINLESSRASAQQPLLNPGTSADSDNPTDKRVTVKHPKPILTKKDYMPMDNFKNLKSKSYFSPNLLRKAEKQIPFIKKLNDEYYMLFPGEPLHQVLLCIDINNERLIYDNSPHQVRFRNQLFCKASNQKEYVDLIPNVEVENKYFEYLNNHSMCRIFAAADGNYKLYNDPSIYFCSDKNRWLDADGNHVHGIRKPKLRDNQSTELSKQLEKISEHSEIVDTQV